MKIKPSQLTIGTHLFQYSGQILQYEIIGINELKTNEHTQIFYILKCLSCQGHTACEIAIKFNDNKDLEYSHMINGYEDYDDEYHQDHEHYKNSQYYWHRNKDYHWFLTRKEARMFIHEKNLKSYEDNIKKAEKQIVYNKDCIAKENDKINALTELT